MCVLLILGLCAISLGIAFPIIISNQVENSINSLWMKSSGYDSWGSLPGKLGLKVVRSYTLYNITNPSEILQGGLPKVVEMPPFPTQEFSEWLDWEYVSKNLTGYGNVKTI